MVSDAAGPETKAPKADPNLRAGTFGLRRHPFERMDAAGLWQPVGRVLGRRMMRPIILLVMLVAFALFAARPARAQMIEPNDFIPLPPGSNALLGYYAYDHNTQFTFANGPTFTDQTGVEVNLGALRYLHYFELGGHPAAVQVYQIFGSESGAEIGGHRLGSAFGATDLALNAAIWPYADHEHGRYLIVVGWLYPPTGTYDPQSAVNLGDNRWKGDVQVGWDQRIGQQFTYDLSFDTTFYGDNNNAFPGGLRLGQDPTYQVQFWANWNWTRQFQTSLGYLGLFGGDQSLDGIFTGQKTQEQRLRAAASYFVTPRLQGLLEVNHDVQAIGTFKQQFGTILRVLYIF